ncbi:hypothetical protein [Paracoccus sp. Ld10]|uniref:hypothetical protein n=1 Tax=Paracoccus sp. Ld10 TaxID=649158 RepID=UPI003866771A
MRLLSNRGLEWLRQRIMALPDPCPVNHPDIGALALAGQIAPVLSGLRGRISPIEVIVLRRLTPELVRQGALRVLDGARDDAMIRLTLAGGLVAPTDPLWQLACEALADDPDIALAYRLALCDDVALLEQAETVLTTLPTRITSDHVANVSQLLMQLYRHGARRPRLSHPRAFTLIFDHLQALADWGRDARCTASVARMAFCLRLLDDDHPVGDMMSELIQAQRPDGSFPVKLGFGTADQTFSDAVQPTVQVAMALHMAAWKRWRGPAPIWLQPHPVQTVARELADRMAVMDIPADMALFVATSLTRATGENWLVRLKPSRHATPADLERLARACFRDPIAARHVRGWLGLTRQDTRLIGLASAEAAWLAGRTVAIASPLPDQLCQMWDRAAIAGNVEAFMECARIAQYHSDGPTTPAIRAMTRRLCVEAFTQGASLPRMLQMLDRLTQLSRLFEPEAKAAAA